MNWHILKLIQSVKSYRGIDLKKSHHFQMQLYFWKAWQFLGSVHIGTKFSRLRGPIVHLKETEELEHSYKREHHPFRWRDWQASTALTNDFPSHPWPSVSHSLNSSHFTSVSTLHNNQVQGNDTVEGMRKLKWNLELSYNNPFYALPLNLGSDAWEHARKAIDNFKDNYYYFFFLILCGHLKSLDDW